IDRLEIAFKVPPSRLDNHIVTSTDHFRGVGFRFRDATTTTGDLCFPSAFKYKASLEMAELFEKLDQKEKADKYKNIAYQIKEAIPALFMDERGMLRASNGKGSQADVWSTSLAVYYEILSAGTSEKTSRFLASAYKNGHLAY